MKSPTDQKTWQSANRAAILERLSKIRDMPDGTIHTQAAGIHFVVITKEGSEIRLWLVEQTRPNTGVIQSEINLESPLRLVEPYTRGLLLALLWQPEPRSIYVAGLGGGRLPLLLHHYYPTATIECAEIDPTMAEMATRFFGLEFDERVRVTIADGRRFLSERKQIYDLIAIDVFLDNGYTPYRMATVEFFQLCLHRLSTNGALAVNLLASDPYVSHKLLTAQRVFPHVYVCPLEDENIIILAGRRPLPDPATRHKRAADLNASLGLRFSLADLTANITGEMTAVSPAHVLYDASPPADYFDNMPSFSGPFSQVGAELPCPCGSGLPYGQCHGGNVKTTNAYSVSL